MNLAQLRNTPVLGAFVAALFPPLRLAGTHQPRPEERLADYELRLARHHAEQALNAGLRRAARRLQEARVHAMLDHRAARRTRTWCGVPRQRALVVAGPINHHERHPLTT